MIIFDEIFPHLPPDREHGDTVRAFEAWINAQRATTEAQSDAEGEPRAEVAGPGDEDSRGDGE